jgi:hypothetical protein
MQLKDVGFASEALGDVDAQVEVEADLDIASAVCLSQRLNSRLWAGCQRS